MTRWTLIFPFTATDPCIPDPCHNHGVCSQNGQGFTCTCQGGFTGDMCGIARKSIIKLCVDLLTIESMNRDQDPYIKRLQFNSIQSMQWSLFTPSMWKSDDSSNFTKIVKKKSKLLKSITIIFGFTMISLQGIDAEYIVSVTTISYTNIIPMHETFEQLCSVDQYFSQICCQIPYHFRIITLHVTDFFLKVFQKKDEVFQIHNNNKKITDSESDSIMENMTPKSPLSRIL